MNSASGGDCSLIHELIDRYLDADLDADELASFSSHMKNCPQLAESIARRNDFRRRLRAAVKNTAPSPELDVKVMAQLRKERGRRLPGGTPLVRFAPAMAVAALVLLGLGLALDWRAGGLRFTPAAQQSYITSLEQRVSPAMQIGLRQHIHCAVFRKKPPVSPSPDAMARELGPRYAELIPALERHLPAGFHVVEAHQCTNRGRKYIHLIATDNAGLMSLLVTERLHGEALENGLQPVTSKAGEPLYSAFAQRFSVAGFETRDHLIYLVSDLNSARNLSLFDEMVPEVARTIRTLGI